MTLCQEGMTAFLPGILWMLNFCRFDVKQILIGDTVISPAKESSNQMDV